MAETNESMILDQKKRSSGPGTVSRDAQARARGNSVIVLTLFLRLIDRFFFHLWPPPVSRHYNHATLASPSPLASHARHYIRLSLQSPSVVSFVVVHVAWSSLSYPLSSRVVLPNCHAYVITPCSRACLSARPIAFLLTFDFPPLHLLTQ